MNTLIGENHKMNFQLTTKSKKDIVNKIWQTIKESKGSKCACLLIYYKKGFKLATECGGHIYPFASYGDTRSKSAIKGTATMRYGTKKSEVQMVVDEAVFPFKPLED